MKWVIDEMEGRKRKRQRWCPGSWFEEQSSEILRYISGKRIRFMQWWGILGPFGICLCNIFMYAKHWEHSSKENTVPDFLKLIFYWEWDQGNRQRIIKETKLPYNIKWYMGLGSPKTDLRLNCKGFICDVSPENINQEMWNDTGKRRKPKKMCYRASYLKPVIT